MAEFDVFALPSFVPAGRLRSMYWDDQDLGTEEKINIGFRRREPLASGFYPEAVLHLAYYSDPRHQVAHTPEVCFRQDGGVINHLRSLQVDVPELGDELSPFPARLVDIQRSPTARMIDIYTFVSNGRFYNDRNRLRWAMGMPGDRRVYYCKTEVAVVANDHISPEEAEQVALELLREAVPVLMRDHLPTREEVNRR